MNMRRALLPAILLLIPAQGRPAEPVRIGVLLSMDGPAGCRGRSAWKGIQAAHKLQPEVLGKPVELVPVNAHSKPSRAACAFFRLVEKEGVCSVIGDVTASCTLAAADPAEKRKIPLVSLSGPVPLRLPCRTYTIWTGISAEHLGQWCAVTCRTSLRAETVAIVQDNSEEFSIGTAAYFAYKFKSLGGKVVHRSGLRAGQSTMGTILENVKRAGPDVLFVALFVDQCALLAKQAHCMGIEAPICAANGVSEFPPYGDRGVEGSCGCVSPRAKLPGRRDASMLVSGYRCPRYTGPWERAGADAYRNVLHAIRQARSTKGDAVCKKLNALNTIRAKRGGISTQAVDGTPGLCALNEAGCRKIWSDSPGRFVSHRRAQP